MAKRFTTWAPYRSRVANSLLAVLIFVWLVFFLAIVASEAQAQTTLPDIAPEVAAPYDRARQYGGWIDADRDCMNTRHEVLAEESLVPPVLSANGCKVIGGLWYGLFTGRTFTDPRQLDIDHLVPLAEAHQSGAHAWDRQTRREYANDLDNPGHLIAVHAGTNRAKGAKDPAEWLPPNESFHCAYVLAWVGVKRAWGLTADRAEAAAIARVLEGCR